MTWCDVGHCTCPWSPAISQPKSFFTVRDDHMALAANELSIDVDVNRTLIQEKWIWIALQVTGALVYVQPD